MDSNSVANRQNPFPLHLVKLRNRALKFLVHFSLVCLAKYPKPHEKWLPMGQGIWGSISHPSGMLWRPFRGLFWHFLQQKPVLSDQYFRFWLHLWNVNSGSRWKSMKFQWEPTLTFYTLLLSAVKTCFSKSFTKCQNRLSLLLKSMKTWIDV